MKNLIKTSARAIAIAITIGLSLSSMIANEARAQICPAGTCNVNEDCIGDTETVTEIQFVPKPKWEIDIIGPAPQHMLLKRYDTYFPPGSDARPLPSPLNPFGGPAFAKNLSPLDFLISPANAQIISDAYAQTVTCVGAGGGNCSGICGGAEMSDCLAVAFIVMTGGMIFHLRRRALAVV